MRGLPTKRTLITLSALSIVLVGWLVLNWRLRDDCSLRLPKDGCVQLEVAVTAEARARGLSGRSQLPIGHGMLFSFASPGKHCFWMKDMHLNIDIIWLDSRNAVTKIEPNVSPDSYPQLFCPEQDAVYVVELPAGAAERNGLTVGKTLML